MISAQGKDSRNPATAGNVWTISPSEPRRTTRKRFSGMRSLANAIEQSACGVVLGIANDSDANAQAIGDSAFGDGFGSVVGALSVNVRTKFFEQLLNVRFRENEDIVNSAKCADQLRTGLFVEDRAAAAFQVTKAGIRVHSDD